MESTEEAGRLPQVFIEYLGVSEKLCVRPSMNTPHPLGRGQEPVLRPLQLPKVQLNNIANACACAFATTLLSQAPQYSHKHQSPGVLNLPTLS
ncbi:mCG148489 [Mus musculus]|nr:mCG148489 [Mus musculus]